MRSLFTDLVTVQGKKSEIQLPIGNCTTLQRSLGSLAQFDAKHHALTSANNKT